ncbi:TPA: hypothetical protein ROY16_004145 [Bacillus thuringiensis]|uniref:hypothetical protein n=1 Tax=Bacillus thuringiensis TaxID=1428 RepID=UPI0015968BA8|nr:hypothetical protein [Bacillus thuringiensis]HDX9694438.1 hypothetical protein [Bacillus thuringiensis]
MDAEFVFWDTSELKKERACRGLLFKKNSFFDQRLQKFKVDGKWYFSAKGTKAFY